MEIKTLVFIELILFYFVYMQLKLKTILTLQLKELTVYYMMLCENIHNEKM